jgi:uncharacterized protein (DUF362 family)/Pyruvate/2-oxoacid:ferredoxin oxidoreductase delta subunit
MPSTVVLQDCTSYVTETLQSSVDACFDGLGGLAQVVRPGARVFCKVNTLVPARPEAAVSTHPEVVRAAIRAIRAAGGVAVVGDNPAMTGSRTGLKRSGILPVVEEEGAEVGDLEPVVSIANPDGASFRSFEVSRAIVECDVLLNLPKLKTHAFMYMTGAVKNLFGLIPGTEKARWHFRAQDADVFAGMLVDLHGAVARHFSGERRMVHLMDGVLAMEGDGPGPGGVPKHAGALLASFDAFDLDHVAIHLAGLDAGRSFTHGVGLARGLVQPELPPCTGTPLEHWADLRFAPANGHLGGAHWSAFLLHLPMLRRFMVDHPVLASERCIGCRRCEEICPGKAIQMAEARTGLNPSFDLDKCIRCYCCAEVCPEGALSRSPVPLFGRLLNAGKR